MDAISFEGGDCNGHIPAPRSVQGRLSDLNARDVRGGIEGSLSPGRGDAAGCRQAYGERRGSTARYTPGTMNEAVTVAAPTESHELSRSLRPRHVAMITIGGIIGAGLFVGSSVAINAAGPAVIISYTLTGFLLLLVMRMLGEMAVEMPQVRSFTEFTRATLGNWAGFSVGWLYWYFWVTVIPVEAIAGAGIIRDWVPLPEWIIGTALMVCMTLVNLMPARAYGEFEFWFSSLKVAAIISFMLV